MKLVHNWRSVLKHAWSIRLMVFAGILSGAEAVLPLLDGVLPIPPLVFAALSFICVSGAVIARFVVQEKVSNGQD